MTQAENIREAFHKLLRDNFRSGFNPASIIDRKKFGRAFCSLYKLESFEPEEAVLKQEARRSCIELDDKFYAIDDKAWEYIKALFKELQRNGTNLVNVDVLFKKFAPKFLELGIISPNLLKLYLQQKLSSPKLPNFLRLDSKKEIESEFAQKLADVSYLPQKEIEKLFPYISTDDATQWAEKVLRFATLRNGDLYLPSAIKFDESELAREMAKIKRAIAEQGYFFYSQLDLSKSRANCADMPEAVFIAALEENLKAISLRKRGPAIINDDNCNALPNLIKEYCRKVQRFSLESIEIEFGSDVYKMRHLIDILQRESFQISENEFINLNSINFDIYTIDNIIRSYNNYDFFPILSFKYFNALPQIDQYSWNKYLFQSYIYHKSYRYNIIYPATNNKCIGIVYNSAKIKNPSYYDLVALSAIRDGISPSSNTLYKYLKQNAFIDRARKSVLASVIRSMTGSV